MRNLLSAFSFFVVFSFAAAMAKEKADRAGVFFFWLLAYLDFYLVGRELTDLRSKLGRRRRDGASWVDPVPALTG